MSDKGKKHIWQWQSIFGETVLRCGLCGLLGEASSVSTANSFGYVGKPVYGCKELAP